MAEILGLGLSHYPGFMYPDSDMAMRVAQTIKSNKITPAARGSKTILVGIMVYLSAYWSMMP